MVKEQVGRIEGKQKRTEGARRKLKRGGDEDEDEEQEEAAAGQEEEEEEESREVRRNALMSKTCSVLRELLKEKGLDEKGKKEELVDRLLGPDRDAEKRDMNGFQVCPQKCRCGRLSCAHPEGRS